MAGRPLGHVREGRGDVSGAVGDAYSTRERMRKIAAADASVRVYEIRKEQISTGKSREESADLYTEL